MSCVSLLQAAVTLNLSYNSTTQTYTVSMTSTVAYNGALGRFTPSSQISIVTPDPDGVGAGTFGVTNVVNLTALMWGFSQINSPTQSPTNDYIFFAPSNAGSYTPFSIAANVAIPLFTFQSAAPCVGTLSLYDNITDPYNANPNIDADNNIKILGGGNTNLYTGNTSGAVACPGCTLTSLTASHTNVACFGGTTGTATATPVGTAPYTYLWSNAAATQTATGLVAGTYTVSVTDANGCTGTASTTITQPAAALTASISASTNVLCFGATTGSATVTAAGGTTAYTYAWPVSAASQTTATASNLVAGTYVVTVTDANLCTATAMATITAPAAALVATISGQTNVLCFGNATGSATVSTTGGTGAKTYMWSNGQTTTTAANLTAGTYVVTATDANGCTSSATATITGPAVALTSSISAQTNVLCGGTSTGSATVTPAGGTPAYSYAWPVSAASQTTATASNLAAGSYIVTVTDANGCTSTSTATITQNTSLSAPTTHVNVQCGSLVNNGSASVVPAGGTIPYTYLWSNGGTTASINNLGTGTYTVTVTDANNCTATSSTTVAQNTGTVTYKLTLDPDGQTYRVSFRSSVAYTGALARLTPSSQFSLVFPDPDGTGAGAVAIGSVTSLTALMMGYSQINSPVQSTTKDYIFFAPSNAGSYTPFNIPANTDIDLFTFKIPTGCVGTISLYDNYADPYNANPNIDGDNNIKVLGGGNTNLYCNNTSGAVPCSVCPLTSLTTSHTNVSCFGGSNGTATATPVGTAPYTYLWSNAANSQTATGLVAGTYTVTVTDINGCVGTATAVITQPATAVTASISATTNVLCFNGATGAATAAGTGGTSPYTYAWPVSAASQTTATASNLAAGTYVVTVTDANLCTATATATITQPAAALAATISGQTNVLCFGGTTGTATVSTTGGTGAKTYMWSNGQTNATATGLAAGSYVVTATDANGCTSSATATITGPAAALTSSISAQTNVLCGGSATGSATVTPVGGTSPYTYAWPVSTASQTTVTASNLAAGTYVVTVTDVNSCTSTSTATITENTALTAATSHVNVQCGGSNNGSASVIASGGTTPYTYLWSNAGTTASITGLGTGTYTVTVTDANNCTATSSTTVAQNTGTVTYKLTLDPDGMTYRVSFRSSVAYTGALARLTPSSQFSLVFPDPDGTGAGAVAIGSVTSLTALTMGYSQINSPVQSTTKDYIFFAPSNAGSYTPFNIPANTDIDLFTFKIPAGCVGTVYLYDNYADPYNANPNIDGDNNFKVLGGGNTNLYCNNTSGPIPCTVCPLTSLTTSVTNVSCFGGSNGTATATPVGTAPYTYLWSNVPAATSQTATGLAAGTYTVTVTDINGCTGTATVTIIQPATAVMASISTTTNVLCFNGTTGSATAAGTGGTSPYTYAWPVSAASQTTATATGLAAGELRSNGERCESLHSHGYRNDHPTSGSPRGYDFWTNQRIMFRECHRHRDRLHYWRYRRGHLYVEQCPDDGHGHRSGGGHLCRDCYRCK